MIEEIKLKIKNTLLKYYLNKLNVPIIKCNNCNITYSEWYNKKNNIYKYLCNDCRWLFDTKDIISIELYEDTISLLELKNK